MITASDSFSTVDLGDYYAILPSDGSVQSLPRGWPCSSSGAPGIRLQLRQQPRLPFGGSIRSLIREHVDADFQPCWAFKRCLCCGSEVAF